MAVMILTLFPGNDQGKWQVTLPTPIANLSKNPRFSVFFWVNFGDDFSRGVDTGRESCLKI
jgi:hypothetical protein